MANRAEVSGLLRLSADVPSRLLAEAYRGASLADCDMHHAAELLEPIRAAVAADPSPYAWWRAIAAAAGQAAPTALFPTVDDLRTSFVGALQEAAKDEVRGTGAQGAEAAARQWLSTFAEAVTEYRQQICAALLASPVPLAAAPDDEAPPPLEGVPRALVRGRWDLLAPVLDYFLRSRHVTAALRPQLLAMSAQIALYYADDRPRGRDLLAEAERLDGKDPVVWEARGDLAWQEFRIRGAREHYHRSIACAPSTSNGYLRLGDLHQDLGDLEAAEEQYLRGFRESPHNESHLVSLIRLHEYDRVYRRRDSQELRSWVRTASAISPEVRYEAEVALARALGVNGEQEQAIALLRETAAREPDRPDALAAWGYILLESDRLDEAQDKLDRALRCDPQDPLTCHWQALLRRRRREFGAAVDWFERSALRRRAERLICWSWIVDCQLQDGAPHAAAETLLTALHHTPDAPALVDQIADVATALPREGGGRDAFLARILAAQRDRGEAGRLHVLGRIAEQQGSHERAAELQERAIALDATVAAYHRSLADCRRELKRWTAAAESLDRALDLDGNDYAWREAMTRNRNEEGHSHYAEADYDKAADCYRQAIGLSPWDAALHANLADAIELGMRPGHKARALQDAVAALAMAAENAAPDEAATYHVRIEQLRHRSTAVRRHGELILEPALGQPLRVEIAGTLSPRVNPAEDGAPLFDEEIPALRARIRDRLGFAIPGIRFAVNDGLDRDVYRIRLLGGSAVDGVARPGESCLLGPDGQAAGRRGWDPVRDRACVWRAAAAPEGLSDRAFILRHLEHLVCWEADCLFDGQLAAHYWGGLEVLGELTSRQRLGMLRLARALVREQVGLPAPADLYGAVRECLPQPGRMADALRVARLSLRPALRVNVSETVCLCVDRPLTAALTDALAAGTAAARMRAEHAATVGLRSLLAGPLAEHDPEAAPVALVVAPELRLHLALLTRTQLPEAHLLAGVFAHDEVLTGGGARRDDHARHDAAGEEPS
ncbi:tetratricopeptide repeat protein [Streptomyces sp. NPDC059063]|uniref:tetratricopeptide repeat protein n=1 Tax=unclassified Streptomyces TaxID=2593676 RepID=UPI003690E349